MAYESKDIEKVIGTVKVSNCTEVRITAIRDCDTEELKSIDIRNWYCTQKDPEMKSTYKGIRIKKDDLPYVLNTILANLDDGMLADNVFSSDYFDKEVK